MKLSVITVNLNNKSGLKKTIESVVSQTYRDFEWIIIDGGSTDGSRELIEEYADCLSYWVSEPDQGIYNAMNKGIRASCGEYLLFLNSGDCLYNKDVLHNVVPLLSDKDIYVGNEKRGNVIWEPEVDDIGDMCELMTVRNIPPQSTFVHRRVFDIYGPYDENKKIMSDWDLFYKALILGTATIEKLPYIISDFDIYGISTIQTKLGYDEKMEYLADMPRLKNIAYFHAYNYSVVRALKSSNFIFLLFRIYYFFYRKILSKYDLYF